MKPYRCGCGREYTLAECCERFYAVQTCVGEVLLLWNCDCGSTRAVRLVPAPEDILTKYGFNEDNAA